MSPQGSAMPTWETTQLANNSFNGLIRMILNLRSTSGQYSLKPSSSSDKYYTFDLESNGFLNQGSKSVSTIWCMVIQDVQTKEVWEYRPHQIQEGLDKLKEATTLIGHNIIFYDVPVIHKLFPEWTYDGQYIDTFILSTLIYPKETLINLDEDVFPHISKRDRGSHSLDTWGQRLGNHKGHFADWSKFSEEMLEYNKQDVMVTTDLYHYFMRSNYSELAAAEEHDITQILSLQVQTGWTFDVDAALDLLDKLEVTKKEIEDELINTIPATIKEEEFIPKRDNKRLGYVAGVPFIKRKEIPFNPGSRVQSVTFLKSKYNWEPTEFTDNGNPKLDGDTLETLPFDETKRLAQYLDTAKLIGTIKTGKNAWLKYATEEGKIHGGIIPNGTISGRASHQSPNLGNVPSPRKIFGNECRALFSPPPGFMQVGSDAKALELRCLGAFLAPYDNGDYAKKVVDPDVDIHVYNQNLFGVETRDIAKTLIYCVVYGGGPRKAGSVIFPHGNADQHYECGMQALNRFKKELPAIEELNNDLKGVIRKRGYLKGIDGRKLFVRKEYSGLNLVLQSAGAVIMKRVGIEIYERITSQLSLEYWKDFLQLGFIHDEYQHGFLPEYVDSVIPVIIQSYVKAGEFFEFPCPIEGDVKVGRNWYECH